jgi:hypothetical protein
MATYVNNLRLKEITTGDEDGTWGTSTNTNLELIGEAFSYGVQEMAADANETFTMLDATADDVRSFYLKITSAVSLTTTREVTLGPNTVSKVWMIENATSGSQIITIKQGSGATVNVPNGSKVMVVTDGAGAGAAVFNANPTEVGGTVTSVGGTGTVNGITLTGTVTSSGNLTLGGTLSNVNLTSQVTGTLPVANGGTGVTSSTGTGSVVLSTSPTFTTPNLGTPSAATLTNATGLPIIAGTTGTLSVARGGTGSTTASGALTNFGLTATAAELNYTDGVTSNIQTQLNAKGVGSVTSVGGTGTVDGLTLSGTVTSSGNLTLGGSVSIDNTNWSGTDLSLANGGTGASLVDPNADRIFFWDDSAGSTAFLTVGSGLDISGTTLSSTAAGGTVTSVDVSGGTTGLTASGGPVTTSGTITLAGTLAVANGGTGLTALGSANQVLAVNGAGTALEYVSAGGSGTVTSVSGTGTVSGLTLTGTVTSSGSLTLGGTLDDINLASGVTGTLPVANGGTGVTSSTGTGSVVLSTSPTLTTPNLGTPSAATLTNASGLPIVAGTTGTLSVARGGTGATSLTSNNVLLGNGTSAPQTVAPGTSGNVLTSNGSTWQSTTPSAGGGTRIYITSVTLGSAAATITIDNAAFGSSTYDYLILEAKDLKNAGGGVTSIKFNYRSGGSNQTASNYDVVKLLVDGSLVNGVDSNGTSATISGANYFADYEAYIQMDIYHQSTGFPMISRGGSFTSTGVATQQFSHLSSYDAGIGSIGGIQIANINGFNFAAGSKLTLYGVKNS